MSASAQSLPGAPAPTGAVAPPLAAAAATNGPPGGPTTTAHFTAEQIATLRAQMHTYKLLGKNVPIPAHLQAAILGNAPGGPGPQQQGVVGERLGDELTRKLVEGVADVQHQVEGRQTQRPKYSADLAELDQALVGADGKSSSSTAVPFGAFTHPLTVLAKHTPTSAFASAKQQRLLMPSVLPAGLDPYILLEERERAVQTRIDWRIAELESLSAMLGERSGPAEVKGLVPAPVSEEGLLPLAEPAEGAKRRALIELKGLQLVDKQRRLRETALRSLDEAGVLTTDRAVQKKVKKHAQRDARRTEELERRQRTEREKKVKQKQNDYVEQIVRHGRELVKASAFAADKGRRLGRMVLSYHVTTEKEEQKRVERISKERLRALKADDEEAYMALLDTAKDTRITHLLRQTDAFLDSLAQAVVAQQNDDVHLHGGLADEAAFETEDGPADEAMFGAVNMVDEVGDEDGASAPAAAAEGGAEGAEGAAGKPKVDYYAVAHRISEKITAQPTILVGGTLKEYQIKGLQWMVSLYNNRLNGILADEMVCPCLPAV
jgi:ATP-dependent helicase STH1/SNF2